MKPISRGLALVSLLLLAGAVAPEIHGQTTGPQMPRLAPESLYGLDLYRMYCATCHGTDGRGHGPAAFALKVEPSDLTLLARRWNGVFPASEVETVIRGSDSIAPHGSQEMPMWGLIFRALDPSHARTKVRIQNLVDYIKSIQLR